MNGCLIQRHIRLSDLIRGQDKRVYSLFGRTGIDKYEDSILGAQVHVYYESINILLAISLLSIDLVTRI